MPNKTYASGTVIDSASLNDFNDATYEILGDGTNPAATKAQARANLGLGNVDNTTDANKPVSTATQTALNLKANLASPALTGNPTAPTATVLDSDTTLATTGFVHSVTEGPSFSARKPSGTQAITINVPMMISFPTIDYNSGQFSGNTVFTCNRKGLYLVVGRAWLTPTSASQTVLVAYKNGVAADRLAQRTLGAGAGESLSGTALMLLNVGDTVDLRAEMYSSGGTAGVVDPSAPLLSAFAITFQRDVA